VGMGSLQTDARGELYWIEGRSQEGGRQVICQYAPNNAAATERGGVDVVDKDANARTRVHEYGGGAWTIHPLGGVIYADFGSQRLFWNNRDGMKIALTPESKWPDGQYRFADGQVDPSGKHLICVREDHGPKGDAPPVDVVNEIVAVALDGSGDTRVLAKGRDFYQAPRVSPDGNKLAYITWDHPSMPWDSTELRIADISSLDDNNPNTMDHDIVAGKDGDTSVLQPAWHPATASLYYISDESGYHNLYRLAPYETTGGINVLPKDIDFGGRAPGWTFGQQGYGFLVDGRVAAHYTSRETGQSELIVFKEDTTGSSDVPTLVQQSAKIYGTKDGLPHSFSGLAPSVTGSLYLVGGGPDAPSGVYRWDRLMEKNADAGEDSCIQADLLASSSNAKIPDGYVSIPNLLEFPSPLGTSYGYYYPPTNPAATSDEDAPPLLVKVHGGPTACTSASFNPGIQFFTSRGFAVLDVDYGGSTGYGREYRNRLRGKWGIVDIDDVCAGAEYLVKQGLADPKRLAIDGGSAGGYTTLGALAFRDVFTAGCSLFGVADCSALAADTHKFESRYLDNLIGKWPQDKALYEERAPINSVDTLSCPILLLQGDEDKIVPPNQAEMMHAALLKKNIPTALKIYKGEQHGFRKAENIEDALNSELFFYSKIFGFACHDNDNEIKPFTIDNLE